MPSTMTKCSESTRDMEPSLLMRQTNMSQRLSTNETMKASKI